MGYGSEGREEARAINERIKADRAEARENAVREAASNVGRTVSAGVTLGTLALSLLGMSSSDRDLQQTSIDVHADLQDAGTDWAKDNMEG